ncbi:PH, RCC1 and FYVE domains-containing protein 1 isoform X2 [Dendrobium catenatum]|uniref:PH, RCC1 and FYVE domains-containing protein 1 isoform X2 n=1 Tax=Dendrobium catenatum TaxID=906689 RepID=UPI0009F49EAC|nr:PH, RCC1 and FYVE domains-containing protein 1 isoform X2 [Dendrobium catenatum]
MHLRTSTGDVSRHSVSNTPSCSSHTSGQDDIESLGDVYIWGEVWSDGISPDGHSKSLCLKVDALLPKALESNVVIDVHQIASGFRHAALVTRQGEVFTWGEECGGRLGHGTDIDISRPRLVESLALSNVDSVACGEFHTCAITTAGDLFTWGDGAYNTGLLGHGIEASHWMPKRVSGPLEGFQVSLVACGTWHTVLATSNGKIYSFGDGSFGVLGHGDRESVAYPREIESLSGLRTIRIACGVWHTAAIVEVMGHAGTNVVSRKLFTWGDGDGYRLGHGDKEARLVPTCVASLIDYNFHQLACGHNITIALSTSGHVFTMGHSMYGELGNPQFDGKVPCLVQDRLVGELVEEIACGSHHVVVLTSRSEVYSWGRGANGRLGHGDTDDRKTPILVEALKDRHVKSISCGSNFTACICMHKWVSSADQSVCTGCRQAFGFTRKRHNCYNCGLVYCHACSSRKVLKAVLAPTPGKPHRLKDIAFPSSLSLLQTTSRPIMTPTAPPPLPAANSKFVTPYSWKPNPSLSTTPDFSGNLMETIKRTNEHWDREVLKLQGEIKSLKQKLEIQDAVAHNVSNEAKEVFVAAQESAKFNAAIELIRTIEAQMKDVAQKVPNDLGDNIKSMIISAELFLENNKTRASELPSSATPSIESPNTQVHQKNGFENSTDDNAQNNIKSVINDIRVTADHQSMESSSRSPRASKRIINNKGEVELMEQFEPGIYATLLQLLDGTKLFKRVKFSKRRFSEQEAEDWWKKNQERVFRKYNYSIPISSNDSSSTP